MLWVEQEVGPGLCLLASFSLPPAAAIPVRASLEPLGLKESQLDYFWPLGSKVQALSIEPKALARLPVSLWPHYGCSHHIPSQQPFLPGPGPAVSNSQDSPRNP